MSILGKDLYNELGIAFGDQWVLVREILLLIRAELGRMAKADGSINISAGKNHENIIISVKDNGIGIAPELLTKLFDISLIHSTTGTAGEKGTGLGLLLCKEFVEKHGGRIWVESEAGKGSTFYFKLQ
jgi:signal transduction histidine kinase